MEPTDFGPDRYGRSFAEVYDRWYPDDGSVADAVEALLPLAGGGRVLELGVGTGRLALPLAAAGCDVTGLDASPDMLDRLASKDPDGTVRAVRGDVGEPADWPPGPFDLVVGALNLLLNLPDAATQARAVATAATVLVPGGHLVLETAVPALPTQRERHLEVREVAADRVVLIATDTDPATGTVVGQHVELVHGEPVRLRPWRVCTCTPADVDRWGAAAGLEVVGRSWDWGDPAPTGATDASITVLRRPA